ncbi:50S ribosomal protein L24 [Candidatus Dojkabacteria bacterium]|uniref:Large ribosomal subunit protein uL24 n=1 Tax=Candidatus Dojkabacteria bacterium TaxID=2099670 RepID=A0A955L2D5_9BACT|nr:50S ribosomal protein L24 [Candidatus Dojkabacteria bacterium]
MNIKKGDKVKVMRGKDAGKTGEVIKVITPKPGSFKAVRVVVKDINIVKKNQKPNPTFNIPGGIIEFESPLDISNVMLVEGSKVTRSGKQVDEKTGKKIRISKKSGKEI